MVHLQLARLRRSVYCARAALSSRTLAQSHTVQSRYNKLYLSRTRNVLGRMFPLALSCRRSGAPPATQKANTHLSEAWHFRKHTARAAVWLIDCLTVRPFSRLAVWMPSFPPLHAAQMACIHFDPSQAQAKKPQGMQLKSPNAGRGVMQPFVQSTEYMLICRVSTHQLKKRRLRSGQGGPQESFL